MRVEIAVSRSPDLAAVEVEVDADVVRFGFKVEAGIEGLVELGVAPFRIPFSGVFSPSTFTMSLELEVPDLFSSLLVVDSSSGSSSMMLIGTRRR